MTNPQQNALAKALEPCPFCAGTRGLDYNDTGRSWVSCSLCETEGPVMPSRGEAIAAWNRRASNNPAAVEGQGELQARARNLMALADVAQNRWTDEEGRRLISLAKDVAALADREYTRD